MYLCARLLSPDPTRESETTSTEDYFYRVKSPFLTVFLYGLLTWFLADPIGITNTLPQGLPLSEMLGMTLFSALLVAGIVSSNRHLHGAVVILILLMQVAAVAVQGAIG